MSTDPRRLNVVDSNRLIGAVSAVFPSRVLVNAADAAARGMKSLYGHALGSGQVGEFVLIGTEQRMIVGRIISVRLLERDRLSIEPALGEQPSVDPICEVELLATFDRSAQMVIPGVEAHPRLGSHVYSPAPDLVALLVSDGGSLKASVALDIGSAVGVSDARILLTPEKLFGRHCGILGATGGGKSFTIARLVEQCRASGGKAILVDATGEFYTQGDGAIHVSLGAPLHGEQEVHLPFSALDDQDLLGLFQPSGKVQGPKLREAIYSLRLAHILSTSKDATVIALREALQKSGSLVGKLIKKEGTKRKPFEEAMFALREEVEAPDAAFDVRSLPTQVINECIWPTKFGDNSVFGGADGNEAHCSPLIARMNAVIAGSELKVVFESKGANVLDMINTFVAGESSLLRISLASIPFSFHAREIVANALGRRLLGLGRKAAFKGKPMLIFLDEAHNFLNRAIGETDAQINLDAFDQIAKEGRKY